MYEHGVTGGALNLNSAGYSDHSRYGDLPSWLIEVMTTKPRGWSFL
jgi:hypothetical protein